MVFFSKPTYDTVNHFFPGKDWNWNDPSLSEIIVVESGLTKICADGKRSPCRVLIVPVMFRNCPLAVMHIRRAEIKTIPLVIPLNNTMRLGKCFKTDH